MTNVKTSFLVGIADEGKRLDIFVQASAPDLSRSRAASLIRAGSITIAGRLAKPSSLMQVGDSVSITVSDVEQSGLIPQSIPIGVVYEDGQFIVIDKPAGLTVHPAPGHPDGTLVNALLALVPDLPGVGGVQRPGIVHRLDKDTSGLIVVAKTDAAHRSLSRQLKERTVRKTYIALLDGQVQGNEWSVDAPIARNPKNRKKMAVVESGRGAHEVWEGRRHARRASCCWLFAKRCAAAVSATPAGLQESWPWL